MGMGVLARFRRLHAGDRGLIAAPWTPLASLCCRSKGHSRRYGADRSQLVKLFMNVNRIASWDTPRPRWSYQASSKPECPRMRIQTILNRVEKFKSFVYGRAGLEEGADGPALVVRVRPRKNGRPHCSGCGRPGPAYDRLERNDGSSSCQCGGFWSFCLPDATRELQAMWDHRRNGALVRRQEPI